MYKSQENIVWYVEDERFIYHYFLAVYGNEAWAEFSPNNQWREWCLMIYGRRYDLKRAVGPRTQCRIRRFHDFHLVRPSIWPFFLSIVLFFTALATVSFFHKGHFLEVFGGIVMILYCLYGWWGDVIYESLSSHTARIKKGIAIGMILFILSEIMFFFSFFWAFFHVSLSPAIELGCVWPPVGLQHLVIKPFGAPLANTLILILSGFTVTCAHHSLRYYSKLQRKFCKLADIEANNIYMYGLLKALLNKVSLEKFTKVFPVTNETIFYTARRFFTVVQLFFVMFFSTKNRIALFLLARLVGNEKSMLITLKYLVATLALGLIFTFFQVEEYVHSPICISDGVYGSTFYMLTGFHGFHVIVGTIFLAVCFVRLLRKNFSFVKFIGFDCAIWYWHFVDVVWLFLFGVIYVWGNQFQAVLDFDIIFPIADYAAPIQYDFQDSATLAADGIMDLHDYIMFYLLWILGLVTWLLGATVYEYKNKTHNISL